MSGITSVPKKKRVITSAIKELDVVDVRVYLNKIRKNWNSNKPFFINVPIKIKSKSKQNLNKIITLTTADFCLKFENGIHNKRHNGKIKNKIKK
jgi:hypothetical protein